MSICFRVSAVAAKSILPAYLVLRIAITFPMSRRDVAWALFMASFRACCISSSSMLLGRNLSMTLISFSSASERSCLPATEYALKLSLHFFFIDCSMSKISLSFIPSAFPFCLATMSRSFRAARISRIVALVSLCLARMACFRASLKESRRFIFVILLEICLKRGCKSNIEVLSQKSKPDFMRDVHCEISDMSRVVVPDWASAVLVLASGEVFFGIGLGVRKTNVGELCFNTSMSGYQEILTDPSYAGEIITFTFPHIGNVGFNSEDVESERSFAMGAIFRNEVGVASNFRAEGDLPRFLMEQDLPGISGIDTRLLTHLIRRGAPHAVLSHVGLEGGLGRFDLPSLLSSARSWEGLVGCDLAAQVSCSGAYEWSGEGLWRLNGGYDNSKLGASALHVVAIDYGIKHNILRSLSHFGCRVTVVPASMSAEAILAYKPDGIFLSNGPGDPMATGVYAVPILRDLLATGVPIFGICLGHQLLALALGAKTRKMAIGHRGANHPVKDVVSGRVEITSQNHGFAVCRESLPSSLEITHYSLFDDSVEGLRHRDKPVFSVQYHPEASPGPQDSAYLFGQFMDNIHVHRSL